MSGEIAFRPVRHWIAHAKEKEAPVRVELTMADLQSAALATWLRRLIVEIANRSNELWFPRPATPCCHCSHWHEEHVDVRQFGSTGFV
jgi:hypothetical protein